ncbi:MAG: hypothetical protein Q7W05_02245 [Deltaproteobacteria bacterium]|nr:hypothetical protein [Deltaproteobacteria bacterium]
MGSIIKKFNLLPLVMLVTITCLLLASGCTRYARNVNTLYEPAANVSGGAGEVYIVIPESQQSRSSDIKWVLGKVKDDDNNNIDEVFSARSPAEIIQTAFARELKRSGYTVIPATRRPAAEKLVIDLSKTEINLEQTSDLADLKVNCLVRVWVDVIKDGQQIKQLQYEATSSKTDIKDRDMLARNVLEDALQSIMLKAVPELHNMFNH